MYRGIFTSAQVKLLQKYIPEISPSDVLRWSITCIFSSTFTLFLWENWQNLRWIIPLSLFPLQGSIGGPSSGSWPSWKPGGWLCLRRRGWGGWQPSAPRAQCSLASGHLLSRHCWNDRRWGGESLRSVERNCRNGSRPKISRHYLTILVKRPFIFNFKP